MSTYDRRTWQRPKGERIADPLWVDDVEDATGRRGKYRVPTADGRGDCSIAGNLRSQYKTLVPHRNTTEDTE